MILSCNYLKPVLKCVNLCFAMIVTKQLKAKPLNYSRMNWMDTNIKSPVWPILTKHVSLTWRTASGADLHEPEWSNLHKHAALRPVNVCARNSFECVQTAPELSAAVWTLLAFRGPRHATPGRCCLFAVLE